MQEASGGVGWVKLPDDLEPVLRLNTDDTASVTLGHRDPGETFLAELETLVATASIGRDRSETKVETRT